MSDDTSKLQAVAALAEPTRLALYRHVAGQGTWVSREQAADAVGIQRTLAAHHLDRLAAEGLLDVEYRRTSGRQGPGAGRPSKLYRRSALQLDVSIPPRQYELAARILADATDRALAEGIAVSEAVAASAEAAGDAIASRIASRPGRRRRSERARRQALLEQLEACGYEPRTEGASIVLQNCPFHDLARSHTELVCGINHRLLKRVADTTRDADVDARLEPQEGRCCVTLHPR